MCYIGTSEVRLKLACISTYRHNSSTIERYKPMFRDPDNGIFLNTVDLQVNRNLKLQMLVAVNGRHHLISTSAYIILA